MTEREISSVAVGTRHRREMGDVDALARSISSVGLLHPIVVNSIGTLIAGERRLAACKLLGWKTIPLTVVDLSEIVRGEFAENADRKDFLPSEIDSIRRALEPLEKAAAKERQGKRTDLVESFHDVASGGKTRDKIGHFAGVSGRTVEKIKAVVEAAEREPEKFGNLIAEMDEGGRVDAAYSKVRRDQKHKKIAATAAASVCSSVGGPFSLIYADPPWKWGHFGEKDKENEIGKGRTPDQHYPTLTYDEIKDFCVGGMPVRDIAHKDAALFLWCTSANIKLALEVMEAWGFTYKAHAVWVKDRSGTGLVFRNRHEPLLYGTRGNMPGPQHQPQSAFLYPRGRHSAKPPEIRSEIEKMFPAFDATTRLEMFARETITGWTSYGFESNSAAA